MKQQPRPTMTKAQFEEWSHANPEPTPDLPALRKCLSVIDNDPEHWDQKQWGTFNQEQVGGEWSCGTARCVAGWATTLAPTLVIYADRTHPVVDVRDTGAFALGLTASEAFDLFEATLFEDLEADVGAFVGREEQRANIQIVAERIAARAGEIL